MRQLRKRLEEYFSSEGKDEPYLILIPKGAYLPVLEPREPILTETIPRPVSTKVWRRIWRHTGQVLMIAGTTGVAKNAEIVAEHIVPDNL